LPIDTTYIITEIVNFTIAAICGFFQQKVNWKSNGRNNKPYKKFNMPEQLDPSIDKLGYWYSNHCTLRGLHSP